MSNPSYIGATLQSVRDRKMKGIVNTSSVVLFLLLSFPAVADDISYSTIEGYGGVPLVVAEAGNPLGPSIVFIHGFSQSLLSWKYQLNSADLGKRYRLIAFDLRGHGASAKPWQPEAYGRSAIGGDVQAVVTAKSLEHPVLVGWSYGGEVVMAYIRHHGTDKVGGLIFVDAGTSLDGPAQPPDPSGPKFAERWEIIRKMWSPDIAVNLEGTRAFVGSLAEKPLSKADSDEALLYNMLTPAYVRAALRYVPDNSDLVDKVNVPVLLIHGEKDAIAEHSVSVAAQKLIKGSNLLTYQGVGHAPFLEAPGRFNRDVAAFVEDALN